VRLTCLIGNGLSIAYNPALSIPRLTQSLLRILRDLGGSEAAESLAGFARTLNGNDPASFEDLLAPLEIAANSLPSLTGLLSLRQITHGTLSDGILHTTQFLRELHGLGLGKVLELVATEAQGEGGPAFNRVILDTCRAIVQLTEDEPITIGTLNYDGLLHAGFGTLNDEDEATYCDLAEGFSPSSCRPTTGASLTCWKLRTTNNLPARRVQLLNLHGSLGWLGPSDANSAFKFELDDLRMRGYWRRLAEGQARMFPLLVLTNRKSEIVKEWPFSLAYQLLESRLAEADHWLIAGYSFQDKPLNGLLRRALFQRCDNQPKVLVIAKDAVPPNLGHVFRRLDETNLFTSTRGLPEAISGPRWRAWSEA
jgi:hypothetical protein